MLILVMGLAMLRMDGAKDKWRGKLEHAFNVRPPPSITRIA
jgi:hypothetical protein